MLMHRNRNIFLKDKVEYNSHNQISHPTHLPPTSFMTKSTIPKLLANVFSCPNCGDTAEQKWAQLFWEGEYIPTDPNGEIPEVPYHPASVDGSEGVPRVVLQAKCMSCDKGSLWSAAKSQSKDGFAIFRSGRMLFPRYRKRKSLPPEAGNIAKRYYRDANAIAKISPQAAAALLRATIEALCRQILGDKRSSLSEMIKVLQSKYHFDKEVEQAMHVLRIIGNEALHPTELNYSVRATTTTVNKLFMLVDYIVASTIVKSKLVRQLTAQHEKKK